jgi:hypothetical protein
VTVVLARPSAVPWACNELESTPDYFVPAGPALRRCLTIVGEIRTDGAGKQKRGRKAKLVDNFSPAKRTAVKRAPRAVQAAPAVPAVPSDEMADILQLEAENQRLRKLLAEKLRAENADLRKRLKLD